MQDIYITLEDGTQYKLIPFVVCPLCGNHKKVEKNGIYALQRLKSKGKVRVPKGEKQTEARFDIIDFKNNKFFSFRIARGRQGLPEVYNLTLKEAITHENPEIRAKAIELAKQIKKQSHELVNYLEELGI